MSLSQLGLSRRVGLALLVGILGMLLARWIHLPGGPLTGALILTGVVRVLNGPVETPPGWLKSGARVVLGLLIGARVTSETIQTIARSLAPVLIAILSMMLLGLVFALVIRRFTNMPLITALCASSPGGLAAMVALADDLGGEGAVVASMHLVRFVSVQIVVPFVVRLRFPQTGAVLAVLEPGPADVPEGALLRLVLLLALGLAVGISAERARVPGGGMLGGMLVAALLNPLWLHLPALPGWWAYFSQLVIGAGVGATLTRAVLRNFRPYALAGVLMTICLILAGLGMGWLLAEISSLDLVTALVGSAPGGADTMVLLASDLNADPQLVAAIHLSRLVLIMLLMPLFIRATSRRLVAQTAATS